LAEETRRLIALARSGRLSQKQLAGGTFTISNLGMFGVDAFTPIHNLPQAAILGIGRIVQEPVVRHGQVVAGTTFTLNLTFDHRVVDGAPAARWLQRLGQHLACLGIR
jgi:pyruvate dehydrogenase E2 component (dihydrolipoamide acetyltransferase)